MGGRFGPEWVVFLAGIRTFSAFVDVIAGWRPIVDSDDFSCGFFLKDKQGNSLAGLPIISSVAPLQAASATNSGGLLLAQASSPLGAGTFEIPIVLTLPEWKSKFDETGVATEYSPDTLDLTLVCNDGVCGLLNNNTMKPEGLAVEVIQHRNEEIVRNYMTEQNEAEEQQEKAEEKKEKLEKENEATAFEDMMNCTYGQGNSICYAVCIKYQNAYNDALANITQFNSAEQLGMISKGDGDADIAKCGLLLKEIPMEYMRAMENINCTK
jgi:hypothetical protein